MSKEKKPRNPVPTKRSFTKKAKPESEGATLDATSAVPAIKAAAKTRSRSKTKSSQITQPADTRTSLEEAIRLRAYEIYLQRGGMPGNPREDWALAEREVLAYIGQNADA